jgi:hypothetical protein
MASQRLAALLAAACLASGLATATTATAAIYTSALEYQGGGAPANRAATPYGTVTIEDGFDGGTSVRVVVSLTDPDSLFVNTGGPHEPFLYNLQSPAEVTVINALGQNFFDGGRTDPAAFEATPFGLFTNKVGCCSTYVPEQEVVSGWHWANVSTTQQVIIGYVVVGHDRHGRPIYDHSQPIYGEQQVVSRTKVLDYTDVPAHWIETNGSVNGISGPLEFYLHDDEGLTFGGIGATFHADGSIDQLGSGNHFYSNDGHWWFTADICDGAATGACTYNVAAQDAILESVPEPAAWAMMLIGFGGAGAMLRRRRSLHA